MSVRNLSARNLILPQESKNHSGHGDSVLLNFSLKVAYDIILKSRQSDFFFPEMQVLLIVVYAILMISGVVSNVLVCFVVMRQCARKKVNLQKSRNLYVVNLAVADLALCCVCTPFTLITLIQREWTFGSLLCKIVPVFQGTNITVSAGTITAIAMDRYNIIVKSKSSNDLQNRKCSGVGITIIFIWLSSLAVSCPLFFYTVIEAVAIDNVVLYEKCIEKWPSRGLNVGFTVVIALIQFLIPVLVLTIIHLKISSYLKLHIKPLRKPKPVIQIHSPIEPICGQFEKKYDLGVEKSEECDRADNVIGEEEDLSKKVLLSIRRRESNVSDNSSNKSCESSIKLSDFSRKNSDSSRKNSDSSRNSSELSPRKRSDFFLTFRENSDFYGFSFSRFSSKFRSSNKNQKRREIRRNRRTTFILSCIALIYTVSWLPMTIFQMTSAALPEMNLNSRTLYLIFAFCHVLAMSSAVTNPLLYGWLNTNFRREFSTIFSCPTNFYSKLMSQSFLHPKKNKTEQKTSLDVVP